MNDEQAPRRVGIIVFTHADYGKALIASAEGILGAQPGYEILTVGSGVDVEDTMAKLRSAVERLDDGGGVVVFTDMFGGTPSNLSISLLGSLNVEVITGVNLPMLLRVFGNRNLPLSELAKLAEQAGREGIIAAASALRAK